MLIESMNKVFFGEIRVTVARTDKIDLKESGKTRFIVNELRQRD
jgi:hypothetical protein